jgi:hypothetical protein
MMCESSTFRKIARGPLKPYRVCLLDQLDSMAGGPVSKLGPAILSARQIS